MSVEERNGSFYGAYMVNGERYHYVLEGAHTRAIAEIMEEDDKRRLKAGMVPERVVGKCGHKDTRIPKLSEAIDKVYELRWCHTSSGEAQKRNALVMLEIIGDVKLDRIDTAMLQRAVNTLSIARGLNLNTANRHLAAVRTVLNAMRTGGLDLMLPVFPMAQESKNAVVRDRVVTNEEYSLMLELLRAPCDRHNKHADMADLAVFLWETGARLSEPINLAWPDVDFNMNTVIFRKATKEGKNTKSGKPRRVVMPSDVRTMLLRRKEDGNAKPFDLKQSSCCQTLRRLLKGTICEGITFHMFRHTLASALTNRGVFPQPLMNWFGWSSLEMVERYSHLSPTAMVGIADVINTAEGDRGLVTEGLNCVTHGTDT